MSRTPLADGAADDRLTCVGDDGQPVYYDERRGTYHTWYDDHDRDAASTALAMAVATIRETDPGALEPLAARVDPEALDAIVAGWQEEEDGRTSDGSVSFSFAQCRVTIYSDGEIVIEPETDDRR